MATADVAVTVEFSGGLEMLFSDQRRHSLALPAGDKDGRPCTIASLIAYLCQHVMKDSRQELFVMDGHLRPGILVLVNDADWELEGEEAYELQTGDNILFVSTLHGAQSGSAHEMMLSTHGIALDISHCMWIQLIRAFVPQSNEFVYANRFLKPSISPPATTRPRLRRRRELTVQL